MRKIVFIAFLFILGLLVAGSAFGYWYVQSYSSRYNPETPRQRRSGRMEFYKPAIYLYPETASRIRVKLDLKANLTASYPPYSPDNGWIVMAQPDGILHDTDDGREYSYLFWEAETTGGMKTDFSKGFVVKGEDTLSFLQKILPQIGLAPKEYNEFITFWYPRMQDNKFNLIHFAGKEYTDTARLDISPRPSSVLRVFMVYKKLDSPVFVEPQSFIPFVRKGFTVVEWGGSEAK